MRENEIGNKHFRGLKPQMRKLSDEAPIRSLENEGESNALTQTWSCLINSDKVESNENSLSSQSIKTNFDGTKKKTPLTRKTERKLGRVKYVHHRQESWHCWTIHVSNKPLTLVRESYNYLNTIALC